MMRLHTAKGLQLGRKAPEFSQNSMQLALEFHHAGHIRLCLILKLSFDMIPGFFVLFFDIKEAIPWNANVAKPSKTLTGESVCVV